MEGGTGCFLRQLIPRCFVDDEEGEVCEMKAEGMTEPRWTVSHFRQRNYGNHGWSDLHCIDTRTMPVRH